MEDCYAEFYNQAIELMAARPAAELERGGLADVIMTYHYRPGCIIYHVIREGVVNFFNYRTFFGVLTERMLVGLNKLPFYYLGSHVPTSSLMQAHQYLASGMPRSFTVNYFGAGVSWVIDWTVDDMAGGRAVRICAKLMSHSCYEMTEICYNNQPIAPLRLTTSNTFPPQDPAFPGWRNAVNSTALVDVVGAVTLRSRAYSAITALTSGTRDTRNRPIDSLDAAINTLLLLREEALANTCLNQYSINSYMGMGEEDALNNILDTLRTYSYGHPSRLHYLYETSVSVRNLIDFLAQLPDIAQQLLAIQKAPRQVKPTRKRNFQRIVLKEEPADE